MEAIQQLNNLPTETVSEDYGISSVTYNHITLYITSDLQKFNVTKLAVALKQGDHDAKRGSMYASDWMTRGPGKALMKTFPNRFEYISGKGTQNFKGWYADFSLFSTCLFSIEAIKGQLWLEGNQHWVDVGSEGIVYILQPPKLVGTNVFKVGQTKDLKKRLKGQDYGKGTVIYGTTKVSNVHHAERLLLNYFKSNGAIQSHFGNEYLELANLAEAYDLFWDADLEDYALGDPELYEANDYTY